MLGRTVGRYKITAKLGEGGMGSVWKADDPLLARTVALKFLSERLVDSVPARRRFLREARAASSLQHSGIATLYDAGAIDDGNFSLVGGLWGSGSWTDPWIRPRRFA